MECRLVAVPRCDSRRQIARGRPQGPRSSWLTFGWVSLPAVRGNQSSTPRKALIQRVQPRRWALTRARGLIALDGPIFIRSKRRQLILTMHLAIRFGAYSRPDVVSCRSGHSSGKTPRRYRVRLCESCQMMASPTVVEGAVNLRAARMCPIVCNRWNRCSQPLRRLFNFATTSSRSQRCAASRRRVPCQIM